MQITIIGGHGKVALLTSPLLTEAGHEVTAVIRNPDHADEVADTGATALVADVERLDTAALTEMLRGADLVVWSAGAGGGSADRTYAVDRDAAIRSMDAAEGAGVSRYLMVSYFGATGHEVPEGDSFYPYADAKEAADAHLRETGLDWVVLGPSRLTDDPGTGAIEVGGDKSAVSRADVAAVIAAAVETWPGRRTIEFNGGDTPIAEALGAS